MKLNTGTETSRKPGGRKQGNTEQAIMDAAEEMFLEHGYKLTTTTMIAEKAGVTHAMLHYYFRTKEQIFLKVLDKALAELQAVLRPVMKKDAPFWETLEKGITAHFNFLAKYPRLPQFLFDTIRFNPEVTGRIRERIIEPSRRMIDFHRRMILEEAASGRIRQVDPDQLLMDIGSLSVSTIMLLQTARKMIPGIEDDAPERFLEERKKEIIELIRSRLYGNIQ